jgi:hypothetical protein
MEPRRDHYENDRPASWTRATMARIPNIHPLESVVALHYFGARAGFNSSERASLLGVSCAAIRGARRASVTS